MSTNKLIAEVYKRPHLWDCRDKQYHSRTLADRDWEEISQGLGITIADCKTKWHSLRTSYTRYLRDLKKMPSGSAAKKRKWYLADAMNFLHENVGPHKRKSGNLDDIGSDSNLDSTNNMSTDSNQPKEEQEDISQENVTFFEFPEFESEASTSSISKSGEEVNLRTIKKKELVAEPMAAYLKSVAREKKEDDDPMLLFFKSVLPEVDTLNIRRKRCFKMSVLQVLNTLLEEQENENMTMYPSRPASSTALSVASGHSEEILSP